jgi:hypothetical protein
VQNALKSQLLAAIEDIYYVRTLRKHTSYANVTVLKLRNHFYAIYGRLTPMAMQENDTKFRHPFITY